jgi:hypothetical protein
MSRFRVNDLPRLRSHNQNRSGEAWSQTPRNDRLGARSPSVNGDCSSDQGADITAAGKPAESRGYVIHRGAARRVGHAHTSPAAARRPATKIRHPSRQRPLTFCSWRLNTSGRIASVEPHRCLFETFRMSKIEHGSIRGYSLTPPTIGNARKN